MGYDLYLGLDSSKCNRIKIKSIIGRSNNSMVNAASDESTPSKSLLMGNFQTENKDPEVK